MGHAPVRGLVVVIVAVVVTHAARLRQLITFLGLSDREFANKIGVSASLVHRILKGERSGEKMSPSIVLGALAALGLATDYWLTEGSPADWFGADNSDLDIAEEAKTYFGLNLAERDLALDQLQKLCDHAQSRVLAIAGHYALPPHVLRSLAQATMPAEELEKVLGRSLAVQSFRVWTWWVQRLLEALGYTEGVLSPAAVRATASAPRPPFEDVNAKPGETPDLIGWDKIAGHLGVSVRTARRWQRDGLPVENFGSMQVAARSKDIEAWQRTRTRGPREET